MTERKPKKLIIETRQPKKRTDNSDIFANLRKPHPVAELLALRTLEPASHLTSGGLPPEELHASHQAEIQLTTALESGLPPNIVNASHPKETEQATNTNEHLPPNNPVASHQSITGKPQTKSASRLATNNAKSASELATNVGVASHQPKSRSKDRHARNRKVLYGRVDTAIFDQVQHFLIDEKMEMQTFLELAAVHLMSTVASHRQAQVASGQAHDDLKIYRSHEDIINLYQTLTGNRWKPADDREGLQFAKTDRRVLEIGMLQTLLNFKGRRINSFKYFVPEIQTVEDEAREAHTSSEQLEVVLKRRRQMWEGKQAEKEQR